MGKNKERKKHKSNRIQVCEKNFEQPLKGKIIHFIFFVLKKVLKSACQDLAWI